jgi:hypothetical protein
MNIPDLILKNLVFGFLVKSTYIRIRDLGSCQPWIRDLGSFQHWIRDPIWKNRIRDLGFGINIPHPQHFLAISPSGKFCHWPAASAPPPHVAGGLVIGHLMFYQALLFKGLVAIATHINFFFSFSTYITNHIHTIQYIHPFSFAETYLHFLFC